MIKKKEYLRIRKNIKRAIRLDKKYHYKGRTTGKGLLLIRTTIELIRDKSNLKRWENGYKEQKQ
ncbi:MAG: hypothetical protein ACRCWG_06530 [Sarcina sp.]